MVSQCHVHVLEVKASAGDFKAQSGTGTTPGLGLLEHHDFLPFGMITISHRHMPLSLLVLPPPVAVAVNAGTVAGAGNAGACVAAPIASDVDCCCCCSAAICN